MDFANTSSPWASESSIMSATPSKSNGQLTVQVEVLETELKELKHRRQKMRFETTQRATTLRKQIEKQQQTLNKLNVEYETLREQAAEYSRIRSSRQIECLSDSLEQKLEYRKQLQLQKTEMIRETERLCLEIQALAKQRQSIQEQYLRDYGIERLRNRLLQAKQQNSKLRMMLEDASNTQYNRLLAQAKVVEIQLKGVLDNDGKHMTSSKIRIAELEEVIYSNSKHTSRVESQIKQQQQRNQQRLKKVRIAQGDIEQVECAIDSQKQQMAANSNIEQQLVQGIQSLKNYLTSIGEANLQTKKNNQGLWAKLKSILSQLDQLESCLQQNCNNADNLIESYTRAAGQIVPIRN